MYTKNMVQEFVLEKYTFHEILESYGRYRYHKVGKHRKTSSVFASDLPPSMCPRKNNQNSAVCEGENNVKI